MPPLIPNDVQTRTDAFVELFRHIEKTRMNGMPVLNSALHVEAVGFELSVASHVQTTQTQTRNSQIDPSETVGAVGVLITPWFMNLVWLPLTKLENSDMHLGKKLRKIGQTNFEFIAAYEPDFGRYEACSLFSPMYDFNTHISANATAREILASLRKDVSTDNKNLEKPSQAPQAGVLPRRFFLFGKAAASGGVA